MKWFTEAWSRLRSIRRRDTLERGLDEEMRFHVDQQTAKYRRAGMPPDEARRQALIRFGGLEALKDATRDQIRPALIEDSVRDVRHGVRVLRRAPGFTAAALITLAVGIGATSAIFSVVRTVMLAPLPYREPDRIVAVWETNRGGAVRNVIAPANLVPWRERTRTLEYLGMVGPAFVTMKIDGQAEGVNGSTVSAEVFHALGVYPALGRAYTAEEDRNPGNSVIVVSHECWQRRLAGRPDVLGMTVSTNGLRRTVIGVMPAGFTLVGQKADFLIPYGLTVDQMLAFRGRGASYVLARLRDGVSREMAFGEMRGIYADLEKEFPQRNARRTVMLIPLQEQMVGELRPALFALIGAVALVLLVACVNVANLLLARSSARERELAMRTALGARRGRLVRQMLVESLVLAGAGGLMGVAVAALCHRGLIALVGDRIVLPRFEQLRLDLPVVAFALITAVVTGILFGLVPAFVSTAHANEALRDGGRHGGGRRLHRLLSTLVVAEVALSLMLLAGAGLLIRSFVKLQGVDPGFRSEGVLTASVTLPGTRYNIVQAGVFFDEARTRLAALPGVHDVAGAQCLPMPGSCIGTGFFRTDRPKPADGQGPSGHIRAVTPAFFSTLGIPRMSGRDFSASDTADSIPVAIVSEVLVKEQFPGEDPIGRRVRIGAVGHANGPADVDWLIVGVVRDIKTSLDGGARATIYVPIAQLPPGNMRFFLRTAQDPTSLATSVRGVVQAMDAEALISTVTLDDAVGATIARPRAISVLVGVFALIALALAAVGVYGVMAYSVRERTQEIGIRMALGATATSVFRLVVGQALRLVILGVVGGLLAAALLTRMLERLLYQVQPLDPWTFGASALTLLVVAAVASYVPARRGMKMAPVDALRTN